MVDECGIGTGDGAAALPDVVVVPCVGFTAAGHRLGYGGGYYDRWLAAHPHVVAVGVAWSNAELDLATFAPQPHDVPLSFIVTEHGDSLTPASVAAGALSRARARRRPRRASPPPRPRPRR